MPLFRLQISSFEPEVWTIANRDANDEKRAIKWAQSEFGVKKNTIAAIAVHADEVGPVVELEKNLKMMLGDPFIQWENGRVIGLDLGCPLSMFDRKTTDDKIEPLGRLRYLRELSLRGNLRLNGAGLKVLKPLERLTNLILDEMQVGDDCLGYFEDMRQLNTLYLGKSTLKENRIKRREVVTDDGLRRLRRLAKLFAVSLDYNKVRGTGFTPFGRLDRVEYFGCGDSPFDDAGAKQLARMPKLKKITLSNTEVTDRGMSHLSGLKHLEELYLDGTKVSDKSRNVLRSMHKLRYLNVGRSFVTKKGRDEMALALPACSISD